MNTDLNQKSQVVLFTVNTLLWYIIHFPLLFYIQEIKNWINYIQSNAVPWNHDRIMEIQLNIVKTIFFVSCLLIHCHMDTLQTGPAWAFCWDVFLGFFNVCPMKVRQPFKVCFCWWWAEKIKPSVNTLDKNNEICEGGRLLLLFGFFSTNLLK